MFKAFRIKYLLVAIANVLFSTFLFAAHNEIDSLTNLVNQAKTEKERKLIEIELANAYTFIEPAKALEMGNNLLVYFGKKNDRASCIRLLNITGVSNAIMGDLKAAEVVFLERLSLSREYGDSVSVGSSLSSLGNVYHSLSLYKKSVKYFNAALKIFEYEKNEKGMATVYGNISNAYKAMGNYKKALANLFSSLKLCEKLNVSTGTVLSNIGNIFADMDNAEKAKVYFKKAIDDFHKDGNDYYEAWGYSNLASVYLDENNLEMAEELYTKALAKHVEQNDQEGLAHTSHTLGNIEFKRKNYDKAIELYQSSVEIYRTLELNYDLAKVYIDWGMLEEERGNKTLAAEYFTNAYNQLDYFAYDFEMAELFSVMAKASLWKNDFKKAYEYQFKYGEVRDSLLKNELSREIAEKEAKYQNEKKQKEIQQLKHQKKLDKVKSDEAEARSKMIILFSVLGAALLGVVVIVLIRSNQLKNKNNLLLQTQNDEISHQKEIIEEKNKDITDSINYAQNIQQAILPDASTAVNTLGESFILFLPRDIVSGDFYWMHKMENDDTFFAVADCTGHGVPGAFMSMMGNDMLNKIIVDHGISEPGKILSELNKEVKNALAKNISADKMRDGMDIMLCKINAQRNKLFYAAAMRSMYVINENELEELRGDKNAIGGNTENDFIFETFETKIQHGNCLYLTTDGFADQFGGADGKKFMSKNMKDLFKQYQHKPMTEQLAVLKEQFKKWKGSYEQIDDVTVMGIRI